jgi:hypothetical protein
MLLSLAGLFGWMVILTFIWWLQPPAIGPRGAGVSGVAMAVLPRGVFPSGGGGGLACW